MAISINDCLSQFLGEAGVNFRFDNWLFAFLCEQPNSSLLSRAGGMYDVRLEIFRELIKCGISREDLLEIRKHSLLPESVFEWFEDSERFFSWLMNYANLNRLLVNSANVLKLSHKDRCILAVDTGISLGYIDKQYPPLNRFEWTQRKSIGALFDFLSEGDGLKSGEGLRRVEKYIRQYLPQLGPRALFMREIESFEDLMMAVDTWKLTVFEAKQISSNVKRMLSQKKYRDESRNKKQLNVFIEKKSIDELDSLAEKYKLSKAKIVEFLINEESMNSLYLSGKLSK